jgi:hypothetical protein
MPTDLLADHSVQDVIVMSAALVMFALGWMAGK